jgi:hypothetical protein
LPAYGLCGSHRGSFPFSARWTAKNGPSAQAAEHSHFVLSGIPGLECANFARTHKDLLSAWKHAVHEVDSRNIVPARVVSDRREFMARTLRPKIKVHDRGWTERPIFGKIRFMNLAGARRKFDVDRFVRSWIAPQDDASI